MYDLIIQNAQILDGTGKDAYEADLAIKNGKIAKIETIKEEAHQTINAAGLCVSPGWIDSHSHSDRTIFTYPEQKEKTEQGITVSIVGQCGSSVAPYVDEKGLIHPMSEYLEKAAATPQGSSAAVLVGFNALRKAVLGTENRAPTPDELEKMKALLRDAMESGAIGMSLGLLYVPGCYADTEEVIALAKVVGEYKGLLASHIRNEADGLMDSVREFIQIIRASGCRAVFSHHKACMPWNWGKVKDTLALIDEENAQGADIYLDVYPYVASSTILSARYVPHQFHPAGVTSVLDMLKDPDICQRIKAWGRETYNNDLSWTMISLCPGHPEYEGLTLNEIADLRGDTDRMETALQLIRETDNQVSACFFMMCEEDVETVIRHPRAMLCTDSASAGSSSHYHPRLRASFPRAIAQYVRERGAVTLPEMIRKMTSLPAHVYGLRGKGEIKVGADADLCIFDPEKISDKADFVHFSLPNEGLHYVIVGGQIALENGKATGVRAAKVLKR
ncbi:MAG: D-aminoacylase [Clostridiales bacterium]|nr:D-aminoacylase [Clostridiales bacterium]